MEKKCAKCNKTKHITEFYKHCRFKDGYRSECKECTKKYQEQNKHKRKIYRKTEKYRIAHNEQAKKHSEIYPEKVKARRQFNNALKNGSMKKPLKCEHCQQEKRLEGHHEDYNKPLSVIWLCRKCHLKIHSS